MNRDEIQQIAETIIGQIRAGVGGHVVASWGAMNYMPLEEGGVRFQVNGFEYKGWVEVVLDRGADAYNIVLTGHGLLPVADHVYAPELGEVLDRLIETGGLNEDEYKSRVDNWLKTNPEINN